MKKLQGKIALITGGNSGIGYESAKELSEQGAQLIITGKRVEAVRKAAAELNAIGIVCDTSYIASIENLYREVKEKVGFIDILFLNAGIAQFAPIELVDENHYDSLFNTNVKGLYFNIKNAVPMIREGGSIILNTSAVSTKGYALTSVYSATKAAVRSFARTLAAELLPKNIRVNAIAPGPIETPIYDKLMLPEDAISGIRIDFADKNPMKRLGTTREIAKAITFLASSDSSYINGIELNVDGGATQL